MSLFKEVTLDNLSDYEGKKMCLYSSPKEESEKNETQLFIPQTFLWLFTYFFQKPEIKRDKTTGKGPFSNTHE